MKLLVLLCVVLGVGCAPFHNPFSYEDYLNGEGYYRYATPNVPRGYGHPAGTARPVIGGWQ
jgi:hypothetical protein